ncbi:RNA 2',3'-cyclic phosphodiesterase [Vitiosangium sp. GDMCC 1.1324]|uniref:RNA 2',3'-cyclic phosphodiesterase n=1 Tax=Vitiosangium sp. (strain GDMCC 1.1324) TaxID=2138576 RepID=UPI000D39DE47|nr:RNA 2',3'-cyclic phosphodiesterase [Vitiosangium sp. GDMCC 1.1324]PTL82895.1 RNA 2',3'-cyclic phosphodiesterase [Vitiosangium sp. GDMCC 1.1324]
MRLFVAVTLGETIEAQATAAIQRLKGLARHARWVPPSHMHLTLSFLGEVEAERVPAVKQALERVGPVHAPLVLSIEGGGSFGPPAHPRVLWAGVGGDTKALGALQADVAGALKPLGFEPEHREYSAHLTLARAKVPRGDRELAECVRALHGAKWGEARVDRLILFESLGGQYHSRAEVALSG